MNAVRLHHAVGMRLDVRLGYTHYAVGYEVRLHTFMQLGMRLGVRLGYIHSCSWV